MKKMMKVVFSLLLVCSCMVFPVNAKNETTMFDSATTISLPHKETYVLGSEELFEFVSDNNVYGKMFKLIGGDENQTVSISAGSETDLDLVIRVYHEKDGEMKKIIHADHGTGESTVFSLEKNKEFFVFVSGYSASEGAIDISFEILDKEIKDLNEVFDSAPSISVPFEESKNLEKYGDIVNIDGSTKYVIAYKVELKKDIVYSFCVNNKGEDSVIEVYTQVDDYYEQIEYIDNYGIDAENYFYKPKTDETVYVLLRNYNNSNKGIIDFSINIFDKEVFDRDNIPSNIENKEFNMTEDVNLDQFMLFEDQMYSVDFKAFDLKANTSYCFALTATSEEYPENGAIMFYAVTDDGYELIDNIYGYFLDSIAYSFTVDEDKQIVVAYGVCSKGEEIPAKIMAMEYPSDDMLGQAVKTLEVGKTIELTPNDFILEEYDSSLVYRLPFKLEADEYKAYRITSSFEIADINGEQMNEDDESVGLMCEYDRKFALLYSDYDSMINGDMQLYYSNLGENEKITITVEEAKEPNYVALYETNSFDDETMSYDAENNVLTLKDGAKLEEMHFESADDLKVVVEGNVNVDNILANPFIMSNGAVVFEFKEDAVLNIDCTVTPIDSEVVKYIGVSKEKKGTLNAEVLSNFSYSENVLFDNMNVNITSTRFGTGGGARIVGGEVEEVRGVSFVNSNVNIKVTFSSFSVATLSIDSSKVNISALDGFDLYSGIITDSDVSLSSKYYGLYFFASFKVENSDLDIQSKQYRLINKSEQLIIDLSKRAIIVYDEKGETTIITDFEDLVANNSFYDMKRLRVVLLSDLTYKYMNESEHGVYYKNELVATQPCSDDCETCDRNAYVYNDVKESDWFYQVVMKASRLGLMKNTGAGADKFEPDLNISRGMVATVLYRMSGTPNVTYAGKFPDVANNIWYTNAIEWAATSGIVSGYKDGTFGPDANITRQDLAIMLRNYATKAGLATNATVNFDAFKDGKDVDSYAASAVAWCVEAGLMSGSNKADGKYLNPKANATRAECAKMFSLLHDVVDASK